MLDALETLEADWIIRKEKACNLSDSRQTKPIRNIRARTVFGPEKSRCVSGQGRPELFLAWMICGAPGNIPTAGFINLTAIGFWINSPD